MSGFPVRPLDVNFREIRRDASTSRGVTRQAARAERTMRSQTSRTKTTVLDDLAEAVREAGLTDRSKPIRREIKFSSAGKPVMKRHRHPLTAPPALVTCRNGVSPHSVSAGKQKNKSPAFDQNKARELDRKLCGLNGQYVRNTFKLLSSMGRLSNKKILFLGSGCSKANLEVFKSAPSRVVFLDSCKEVCEKMVAKLNESPYPETSRVVFGLMQDLAAVFPDGSKFDTIIAMKSVGQALADDTSISLCALLDSWLPYLNDDGTIVVDNLIDVENSIDEVEDTYLSSFYRQKEKNLVATNFGKFNDRLYSIRNSVERSQQCSVELKWDPVDQTDTQKYDDTLSAQRWCQALLRKKHASSQCYPGQFEDQIVQKLDRFFHQGPLMAFERKFSQVTVPGSRGQKLTPSGDDATRYTDPRNLPKFDGIMGHLRLSENILAFASPCLRKVVRHNIGMAKKDIFCQAELIKASATKCNDPGEENYILMITGVCMENGSQRNVNNYQTLATLKPFARLLAANGILVTSSLFTRTITGNSVKAWVGSTMIDLPVDGINVPISGSYGHFLKPSKKYTIDSTAADILQLLNRAMEANLAFQEAAASKSSVIQAPRVDVGGFEDEEGVLEFECVQFPHHWKAIRSRGDKLRSASRVRAVFDFNCVLMSMIHHGSKSRTTEDVLKQMKKVTIRPGEYMV